MVNLVDILDNAPYQKIPTLLTDSQRFANIGTMRGGQVPYDGLEHIQVTEKLFLYTNTQPI